ncbi:MAG: peptidyl-prolyl cis-trans isomerase, EpsD family [Hydrogenophilales bacterium 28-61-23]|nr:MAG: peptidyl-prolyl cis-trans isomerase, EpsD family [Hydrogenophilales bacterium 28-61-23]
MQKMHRIGLSALTMAIALTLAGCGDKKEDKDKAATQVAAKVNGDEITVHQLNFELSKMGNLSPEQAKSAANQVLKSMVDQQLMVQKAVEDKVDRDPQVVQTLEAARRQILAQALIQKATANQAKPSDAEIADYYAKNPALFAERRIYRLQEINVQVTPTNVEAVKAQLQQTKNLNDFVTWLKTQNIPARAGQSTKAAEQLPLELLPKLHQLKDGQAMTFSVPGALNILILGGSQSQPLTQEKAKPMIERYLENAKKRATAEAELKKLKEKAKVEYLGEYTEAGKEAPAPQAAPTPAAPAAAQPPAGVDASAMEKGVSGLK